LGREARSIAAAKFSEVADPAAWCGPVVESSDGACASCSNASQSQRTPIVVLPEGLFGSGVEHIAFATDDLWRPWRRLEQNGVRCIPLRPRGQREYLQVYTEPTINGSSSRSSSAALSRLMGLPTRRSGWPRRPPVGDGNALDV